MVLAPSAEGAKTTAYTYIGEKMTWDIYWHGTIGAAKQDLDRRVVGLREQLAPLGGDARVSVLKAVVTQASAAIPAMPIYLAILFKVMKARGVHEGCIEQINRLFRERLYGDGELDEASSSSPSPYNRSRNRRLICSMQPSCTPRAFITLNKMAR